MRLSAPKLNDATQKQRAPGFGAAPSGSHGTTNVKDKQERMIPRNGVDTHSERERGTHTHIYIY